MQLPLENDDYGMRPPGFTLGQDLASYFQQIRKVVFGQTDHRYVTVVLGNPSCDLDSFISAFVLSYFYNAKPNASKHHERPIYVPVLNLPYTEPGELWRLRPEFGVAIRGAFDGLTPQPHHTPSEAEKQEHQRREKPLLEQLITIHELANNKKTLPLLQRAFLPSDVYKDRKSDEKLDLILVDHNAPAIETITPQDDLDRFRVVGCIDHHVEEDYAPKKAEPRIIRLGIGSCMTLVTAHLRDLNLWTGGEEEKNKPGFQQISRLALTPILIDTWDLKAPGNRVSDLDREQVSFLEPLIGDDFNRVDLFQQVLTAKSEALDLLRMPEIFAHDYKSYEVDVNEEQALNIGIGSVVRDLSWLGDHAGGKEKLADEIVKFARHGQKLLEIFGLLTRSGDRKEVCIFAFGEEGQKAIDIFEKRADILKLQPWDEDDELSKLLDRKLSRRAWKVWWMGDTSQSRKQVAPLLRDALSQQSS